MTEATHTQKKNRILLHVCCGPCSMEPVRLLRERGIEPTLYYCNPNIQPEEEYLHRKETLMGFAQSEGITVVEGNYCPQTWEEQAGRIGKAAFERFGLIADEHAAHYAREQAIKREGANATIPVLDTSELPSLGNTSKEARAARAARCRACYHLRFAETAHYACDHGFSCIGTSLSVSPYQHTEIIREELERAAHAAGITACFEDYRPYYENATRRSREAGMYRQNFCGCNFSRDEADAERAYRRAERKLKKRAKQMERNALQKLPNE